MIVGYEDYKVANEEGWEGGQQRASLWTSKEGKQSIQDWLAQNGILLPNWVLKEATRVTPNGHVIAGQGEYRAAQDSTLQKRAWRVFLGGGKNLF